MGSCQSDQQVLNSFNTTIQDVDWKAKVFNMLNEDECFDMLDQCGQLTYDPACEKHVARSKRIAFVQFYKGEIVRSEQDFFI